jgi:hypothetical protein
MSIVEAEAARLRLVGLLGGRSFFSGVPLQGFNDFLAMDRHIQGCFDADADLVPADINNRDDDVVADEDSFVALA